MIEWTHTKNTKEHKQKRSRALSHATHKPASSPAHRTDPGLWLSGLLPDHPAQATSLPAAPRTRRHLPTCRPFPELFPLPGGLVARSLQPALPHLQHPCVANHLPKEPPYSNPTPPASPVLLSWHFSLWNKYHMFISRSLLPTSPTSDTSFGRGSPGQHGFWDRAWHTVDAQ